MKFYSKDFENMATMPERFTADGDNISPTFIVEDVPGNSVSLSIICHDPDATRGVPWVHWVVWGLPINIEEITSDSLPYGAVNGLTSFGTTEYGGPSPSPGSGPHRYIFTLYALRSNLSFMGINDYETLLKKISGSTITSSTWTGIYERK